MPIETDRVEHLFKVSARFSDLTLVAGIDNAKFPVHREIILNTQPSNYFKALLGPEFRKGNENEIILKSIDGPTLRAVIHYIYIGHIALNGGNIESVLAAASGMELVSLEKKCEEYLNGMLNKGNCALSLLLADKYHLLQLRASAMKLVRENFENIPMDDILQMDGTVFTELLQSDQIWAPETHIFETLVKWSEHYREQTARVKFMPDLLKSIRLECFPAELMSSTVEPFFRKHGCIDILMNDNRNPICPPQPIRPYRCSTSVPKNMYYFEMTYASEPGVNFTIYKYTSLQSKVNTGGLGVTHLGLAFHGSELYLLGGYGVQTGNAECIEMSTWNRKTLPNMLRPRAEFNPIVFNNFIYVFGGSYFHENGDRALDECERFDISNQRWDAVTAMPRKLFGCVAIELKGKIYVAGGEDGGRNSSGVIYRFDPNGHNGCEWEVLTYLHLHGFKEKILLAKSDAILYVIVDGSTIHPYDTEKNIWMKTRSLPGYAEILKTVDYFGQTYALYKDGRSYNEKIGKINFENESIFGGAAVDATVRIESHIDAFLFVW